MTRDEPLFAYLLCSPIEDPRRPGTGIQIASVNVELGMRVAIVEAAGPDATIPVGTVVRYPRDTRVAKPQLLDDGIIYELVHESTLLMKVDVDPTSVKRINMTEQQLRELAAQSNLATPSKELVTA